MNKVFLVVLLWTSSIADLFFTCWLLQFVGPGENVWWGFPTTLCLVIYGAATFVYGAHMLGKHFNGGKT